MLPDAACDGETRQRWEARRRKKRTTRVKTRDLLKTEKNRKNYFAIFGNKQRRNKGGRLEQCHFFVRRLR